MQSYYKALGAGILSAGLVWVPFVNIGLAVAAPLYSWKVYTQLNKHHSPKRGIAFTGFLLAIGQVMLLIVGFLLQRAAKDMIF